MRLVTVHNRLFLGRIVVGWVLLVIVAMGVLAAQKRKKSPYPKTRHECPKCHHKTAVKL
jgi:hypothetical protein